jgi:acetyltransferase-like isoleucine patch superfamily enzyme
VHIVCHDRVLIGDHVSIAANCAIVDVSHDPERRVRGGPDIDPERSIVDIGEGTFIGFGAVVLPNVRIGKGCFIGAGSVVSRDIPDYMVAAGAPARILRAITIDGAAQR